MLVGPGVRRRAAVLHRRAAGEAADQPVRVRLGDADAVDERLLALIQERHIGLPAWSAAQEPGRIATEFAVSRTALKLEPAEMAALVAAAIAPGVG